MMHYGKQLGNPIIVALDKAGKDGAIETIQELGRSVWGFKLGALLLRHGTVLIDEIRERVGSVNLFVDLQFTGNPDFLREAVSVYSSYSADIKYIVVSATSGPEGIRAAVETSRISHILVGSVLDSLRIADVNYVFGTYFREEKNLQFARMGQEEKAGGIYCSAKDLEFLSQYSELRDFPKIVFGVRPKWNKNHGTHKYVMTPREALARGATKFVIGGTIRDAKDKKEAVRRICEELG
ncbi:MAG: hypothetical protein A2667_01475 [Candidatus Wildermuthbacteria bacterium RIFCSPHIGHO2_01_FULL_47_27]|uniref:Orotidine 5'-phosphate decarboxylase n=2 Tax=Candidatus Wildermuthiibacteriota TaxID=1817923 RepID=A0A1G2RPH1_9BACT|nr:MAG: Orotidine 5'-phosphate decarboxylase [Parcubacteria group bacterium GW2011_GWA2_47_9]OHA64823.1 MAG: hypothetical protein A2667_01475 [Candidatus Wildermuthbacteria bacterium RIFCSPHIGHO2_01_FULL_47_27]OHA68574.1 MAG: hypothetical protein A3D59_00010 [Candidatus Wildermuthbacteria bacterium RIFCSPHIGHO2_02_FULL_47_17]OHA74754.1 MAG: hypothetical protein A3A32_02785 [Candidatus Wildermuthbacteria bacterium RIFCSPLOWO2_01_FULL_48_35]OHA75865.1 MAG: hypothetical protein A3I38_01935 [Candid